MSSFRSRVVFFLLLACLSACEPSPPPGGSSSTGTIQLAVSPPAAFVPWDITRVTVTVSAPDMSTVTTDLASSEGVWGGVLGELPAGAHRTFLAQAFNLSNTLRYQGRAEDVTVTAGATGLVSFTLQELSASAPFTNAAPILDSLSATPVQVTAGGSVSLLANAHDPNPGDSVGYVWSAASGGFAAPSQQSTTWTAPMDPGPVHLKLQVSDSRGAAFTVDVTVQVVEGPSPHWSGTGARTYLHAEHQLTLLPTGKVLSTGGVAYSRAAELYDPASGTWSSTGSMASTRAQHTATLLPDGRVLIAGGRLTEDQLARAEAEVYDPATGTWSPTGSMSSPRKQHTATLLPDGRVLVSGGNLSDTGATLATAELYDPATGTWSPTGSMVSSRSGHTAIRLTTGQVLVSGGFADKRALATAELYDPATGTWSATGALSVPRALNTATRLSNGKVLVAGGYLSDSLTTAELYDPATGTWSPTGAMNSARSQHTATLLLSGQVLVAGGSKMEDPYRAPTEVYDPATGTWSRVGSMRRARVYHAAALLPSGQVLVSGGQSRVSSSDPDLDDLYTP